MPIPLMNFPILSPTGDMIDRAFSTNRSINDAIAARLQAQNAKQQMQQSQEMHPFKLQEADLQNQLNQFNVRKNELMEPYLAQQMQSDLEYAMMRPQIAQSEMDYRAAQAERARMLNQQGPAVGRGIAGQIQYIERLREEGKHNQADYLQQHLDASLNAKLNPQIRAWTSLSKPEQNEYVGKAKSMGYDQTQAAALGMSGVTLEEAAAMKGLTPDQVDLLVPQKAETTATQTRNEDRIGREAESEVLNKFVTESIKPFLGPGTSITGMSTKQLDDLLRGKNKSEQARLIAAYKIQMDLAANQLKLGAGIAGITAIKEQMRHSLTELKPRLSHYDPDVWAEAQYIAQEVLSNGAIAYTLAAQNTGKYINEKQKKALTGAIKEAPLNLETLTPEQAESLSLEQLEALVGG